VNGNSSTPEPARAAVAPAAASHSHAASISSRTCRPRVRQRLEHHQVPGGLLPVALVALVDHRDDARQRALAVTHAERVEAAIGHERALPGEDGQLERDERPPPRARVR
jgi:hypothetical protein